MNLIKGFIVFTILILTFVLIVAFKRNDNFIHKDLIIDVDSSFLDKSSVRDFLLKENLLDSSKINYNNLESKFLSNSHVKDVTIYKDLLDNLNIGIEQYQPIARIVSGMLEGNYINKEGHIFPTSQKFSKRVILLHINDKSIDEKTILSSDFGNNLVEMIKYINDSEFFSKIISELEINQNKNIIIHPQFSKQKIIFGYPDNLEEKFEKINIFYKKIIPAKGWNTYRTVNVKFKNQIVCDKS